MQGVQGPRQILCIEDNATHMLLIARVVEAEGWTLLQAQDSDQALAILERVRPDLILLDLNLPGMNGLELARTIRRDAGLRHIPMIATTANALAEDRERCLAAGCDVYLPKPLDIRVLRELLHRYLGGPS